MTGELIVGLLLILGAATWRAIKVWQEVPEKKHTVAEYADAFFFPDNDREA